MSENTTPAAETPAAEQAADQDQSAELELPKGAKPVPVGSDAPATTAAVDESAELTITVTCPQCSKSANLSPPTGVALRYWVDNLTGHQVAMALRTQGCDHL